MPLNEVQRLEFSKVLESDLFRRVVEEAMELCSYDVSLLLAPEAGIAMAQEKGARVFLKAMRKVCQPEMPRPAPVLRNQITRPTKPQP